LTRHASRLQEIIGAATRVFVAKGYRRTQMSDVTDALVLSAGAIYRYFESKEALFDMVVRTSAGEPMEEASLSLPLPTPPAGATLAFLEAALKREGRIESLERALKSPRVSPERTGVEFEEIVRELYAITARYRVAIQLLDRSALDWPGLAQVWSGKWRANLVDRLGEYLRTRIGMGVIREVPDVKAWARFVVETVAFFALHRHYDPHPTPMDERVASETAISSLAWATLADSENFAGDRERLSRSRKLEKHNRKSR
jgi:AcrR family transcriptional regulator